jgi:dienelactone hydrolase
MLSTAWYGDFDFEGRLEFRDGGEQYLTAIELRYAAQSESYQLVLDARRQKVYLVENHFGDSRVFTSTDAPGLDAGKAVNFHVTAAADYLSANLWPDGGDEKRAVHLSFAGLKIPEGRLGLGVRNGRIIYSALRAQGQTQSSFTTYAFHCNYSLPERVSKEPLWQYLDAVGSAAAARRPRRFSSRADFERYRTEAVLGLRRSLGLDPWPPRTPLNPRVVGTVDRSEYRIEKVIFESQPGFLVDALLYVPKRAKFPAPAVLSPIGHYADQDFFIWSEQARCIGLARKGYVVLTYDPISQGERTWIGRGVHDTVRRKIILSGMEASGLMFWDSIRAIDYLVSRPEVDAGRIGVTGVSGGGFNSLYTAVLDDRVKAVAPDGYATTLEALIKRASAGCCAYLPNMSAYADIDEAYSLIAPRKLLILGGYMDTLSDRLLQIYERTRDVYDLYGARDSLTYYLDQDAGHTYSKPMRLQMYRWFNQWLQGTNDPAQAREPRDSEDFLIGKDSKLLQVFGEGERGKDVIDLEREYLARNRIRYEVPSDARKVREFQRRMRSQLVSLMGDMAPARPPAVISDDRAAGEGSVRHVVLLTERELAVPVDLHYPVRGNDRKVVVLYFTMEERYPGATEAREEAVLRLVREGYTVAVPQVRGSGTTRVQDMNSVALYSMALGKHLFSTRIYDLQRVLDYLREQPEFRQMGIKVWGEGMREGLMVLYLAAIDERVTDVVSSHGLVSYQNVVDEDGLPDFDYYVPGVLKYADVAEFIGTIAPRRVVVREPVDINGKSVAVKEAKTAYQWAEAVYRVAAREGEFQIVSKENVSRVNVRRFQ